MDQEEVASSKKNAWRLRAWIVFIDESGLMTSPLVRRTWAPSGQTPVLIQRGNTREKASVIGALAISPKRRKVRLLFSLRPHENVKAEWVVEFLRDLSYHLGPRMVVIWDRLNAHRAKRVQRFVERKRYLRIEYFPAYAPELNAVEYLWGHTKTNPLANWAPMDVNEIARVASREFGKLQRRQDLLRSFLGSTPLSLCLR